MTLPIIFLIFGIRHLGSAILNELNVFILLKTSIYRGNRNIKVDRCIEECPKSVINVSVMKFRENEHVL